MSRRKKSFAIGAHVVIDDYDSMVGGLREEFAVEKRVPDVLPPAQPQPPAPKIETGSRNAT